MAMKYAHFQYHESIPPETAFKLNQLFQVRESKGDWVVQLLGRDEIYVVKQYGDGGYDDPIYVHIDLLFVEILDI